MKAIVEVNESKGNTYALTALKNRDDYASLFSYALALKREKYYSEAIEIYQKLLLRKPDPAVYVDLGNCYVGMGNMDEAMASYLKAVEIRPLASAYYNLSQISREMLDYSKGNDYFKRALEIDRDAVSSYRLKYSRNPNRIVVDETLSFSGLWDLAMTNTGKTSTFGMAVLSVDFYLRYRIRADHPLHSSEQAAPRQGLPVRTLQRYSLPAVRKASHLGPNVPCLLRLTCKNG